MSAPVKSDNPNVIGIKHMAFAVKDARKALEGYSRFLCVPGDTKIMEYEKSRNRVALFNLGGVEYQLCESMDDNGRFANWIKERGGEGLHHICYEVDSIDKALAHAQQQGATCACASPAA
jgi:methylmalonyl-CoA/ethylmalonyl-CoA epimerase